MQKKPLWALHVSDDEPPSQIKIKTEKKFGISENNFIICSNCRNPVAIPEHIITVNEQHTHTFKNPEGVTYEIGCFSLAEGCAVYGEATLEHTWFDGFTWSLSICSNCLTHLGWFYESGDESFFGLILDLLTDTSMTH